ncbi:FAD-dependent thymidylate synthase [candidate division WOR-3 bacterium]|nr:FAD-dependent thymidylate synthase [candidate division WOR-3 bacterium]
MKVRVAGFNVDYDALKKHKSTTHLTPETLPAAYARISRSPKPVDELRVQACKEVKKARASNKTIIFGMGHHSVAEHAVFNFDIIGISRRAVEELELYRLCSYTEKSQRYVTLKGDFVIPEELKDTPLKKDFVRIVHYQNECYGRLFKKIAAYNLAHNRARTAQGKKLLENHAKEDARYILSLATQAQLGMTANARNLELIIRRFASHPMHEVRQLGARLYGLASRIAPSLLLFCTANAYDQKTYSEIAQFAKKNENAPPVSGKEPDVILVRYTRNADNEVLAALLFHVTGMSLKACRHIIARMSITKKKVLFKTACQHAELYDTMLREFEQANLTYQLIVSAGCFGQLKRHRLATLICQEYDVRLGATVPESVKKVGEEKAFMSIINATEKVYRAIHRRYPAVSSYVLTNAHRRRVVMGVNLRELYHVSRLREDPTAQWDIRSISTQMTRLARKAMPICGQLLGGKEDYPRIYKRVFKHFPKVRHTPEP